MILTYVTLCGLDSAPFYPQVFLEQNQIKEEYYCFQPIILRGSGEKEEKEEAI